MCQQTSRKTTPVHAVRLTEMWYARHGRELMGGKCPMCESCHNQWIMAQKLADGKGVSARKGLGVNQGRLTSKCCENAVKFL